MKLVVALIVIALIAIWLFGDVMSVKYNIYTARKSVDRQQVEIEELITRLKNREDELNKCKQDPTKCPTIEAETQITMLSAGIGDHRSELAHIRNSLTDIRRQIDEQEIQMKIAQKDHVLSEAEMKSFQDFMADIKARLADHQKKLDSIRAIV